MIQTFSSSTYEQYVAVIKISLNISHATSLDILAYIVSSNSKQKNIYLAEVGFEPTPPKRLVP